MKNAILPWIFLLPLCLVAQWKSGEVITLTENQQDDNYLAGKVVTINATVQGDVVAAGSDISINDTIAQDLIIAGGDIKITGYVADDIRAAGGTLTLSEDVGDDVVLASGEALLEKGATIQGNLISFSGVVHMNGNVKGTVKASGGELYLNGKIDNGIELQGGRVYLDGIVHGDSKIVAEDIEIGKNAQFYGDVTYWCEEGEVDFSNAMVNATAIYDSELAPIEENFIWKGLGMAAFGFWIFYVLSAFLILLLLNWGFKKFFAEAAANFKTLWLKGFGNGIIYVFGMPLLIVFTFMILIGIPIGLFLLVFYLFSLVFGHLLTALLIAHYINDTQTGNWNFWTVTFLAWGIAMVLRLLTLIPFVGVLISIVVIALAYGILGLELWKRRRTQLKPSAP